MIGLAVAVILLTAAGVAAAAWIVVRVEAQRARQADDVLNLVAHLRLADDVPVADGWPAIQRHIVGRHRAGL